MNEELLRELELGIVDSEPLFVMAYHSFLRSPDFDVYEKSVFMVLKSYAGNKNSCFPGQSGIARDLKISRKKVNETLQQLEEKGALLSIQMLKENNRKTSKNYILASFDGSSGKFNTHTLDKYRHLKDNPIIVKGK